MILLLVKIEWFLKQCCTSQVDTHPCTMHSETKKRDLLCSIHFRLLVRVVNKAVFWAHLRICLGMLAPFIGFLWEQLIYMCTFSALKIKMSFADKLSNWHHNIESTITVIAMNGKKHRNRCFLQTMSILRKGTKVTRNL